MTALEPDGRSLRNVHGMSTYIDDSSYRISRSLELCHNNIVTSNMRIPEPLGRTKDSWAVQPMIPEPKEVKLLSDQLRNFRWPGIFLQVLLGSYRKLCSAPGALLKYFKHAACMKNTRKKFWQDPSTFEKCTCLQSELHCSAWSGPVLDMLGVGPSFCGDWLCSVTFRPAVPSKFLSMIYSALCGGIIHGSEHTVASTQSPLVFVRTVSSWHLTDRGMEEVEGTPHFKGHCYGCSNQII